MAINGAKNAALFAAQILALRDDALAKKIIAYREQMATAIELKDDKIKREVLS